MTIELCLYNAPGEQSDNGDVIDCVHVYHHQPELKKHPSPRMNVTAMAAAAAARLQARPQTWQKYGSCPEGTAPIRRASPNANSEVVERVLRASPFGRPGGAGKVVLPESMDTSKGKVEVINLARPIITYMFRVTLSSLQLLYDGRLFRLLLMSRTLMICMMHGALFFVHACMNLIYAGGRCVRLQRALPWGSGAYSSLAC